MNVQVLTVDIVHLEQEPELVGLAAVDEQVQSFEQLVQTDGAAAVRVEQSKETLGKERLRPTQITTGEWTDMTAEIRYQLCQTPTCD